MEGESTHVLGMCQWYEYQTKQGLTSMSMSPFLLTLKLSTYMNAHMYEPRDGQVDHTSRLQITGSTAMRRGRFGQITHTNGTSCEDGTEESYKIVSG